MRVENASPASYGFAACRSSNRAGLSAIPGRNKCDIGFMPMGRLAAMEAFVLVVDTGSFSAAARRLKVGQPAVSKLVAQLEDRLGVKLLVRTTRGLTTTEAGLNFYERARRAIEEADEAELVARGAGRGLTGKLRV